MNPISEADALLRSHAEDMQDRLDEAMEGTRSRIATQVQEHPMRTVLIAVGAGVLLGVLFGIGKRRRRS